MDIGSLLLALALVLLVAAFVARPLLNRTSPDGDALAKGGAAALDGLIAQREAILIELRDLDFDHSTGKMSEDDFATQRARLVARGSEILRALDQHETSPAQRTLDDDIERLVRARRKGSARQRLAQTSAPVPAVPLCPNCHQPIKVNDKFCPKCGARIPAAEAV